MAEKNNQQPETVDIQAMVNDVVTKAQKALEGLKKLNQEQIDKIIKAMALAGLDNHMELAKLAIEETGKGVYEDKMTKNIFATEYIYHSIKYDKTIGVIEDNNEDDFMLVAEPVGVVAGITPVTNPTSTAMFKSLISIKAGNPIVFGFHPQAQKCSVAAAKVMLDAAVAAGAPENCVQWIEVPSIEATQALMHHPLVKMILATGGPGLVKSAYSAGKPAIGVGSGNVPAYIHKSANIQQAVNDVILSKTFDNGMICASEQAVIIDKEIYNDTVALFKKYGCHFLSKDEIAKVSDFAIDKERQSMSPKVVGQPATKIAELCGVKVPAGTKILIAELDSVGPQSPLSREKLSPILACFKANSTEEGIQRAKEMTEFGGLGHSAAIHASDDAVIEQFAKTLLVGRLIVNSPSTHGGIGDLYNTTKPSLTLGCGSFGNNSTTHNVSATDLINVKRVAKRRVNMQWFKVPEKVYFEFNAIQYLEKIPNVSKVFIVTDPSMVKLGFVDKLLYHLRKRMNHVHTEIFSEVEPDPSFDTVNKGVSMMNQFQPDTIIALGGGSAMDAAKGMWLFYEYPDVDAKGLTLKFLDIRKRAYKFPKLGKKCQMVAVPTTSGTGSEVTSFAVITDKVNNIKYPLADYELTPDVAIIDPGFVMTVPKRITGDTGMDVLTHALEAYVSIMASDYTDGLALNAVRLVVKYLPLAYNDGSNKLAREKMHNASCIAGMAFSNAFLGLCHSMAHKLGGEFHVPHGRANAIILPYVIEYNGTLNPSKFVIFPKYDHYVAPERYAEVAAFLGLPASTPEEGVKSLVAEVQRLLKVTECPTTIAECGVDEKEFLAALPRLCDMAFEDQCTPANPRLPLVSEIRELYLKAYYGVEKYNELKKKGTLK